MSSIMQKLTYKRIYFKTVPFVNVCSNKLNSLMYNVPYRKQSSYNRNSENYYNKDKENESYDQRYKPISYFVFLASGCLAYLGYKWFSIPSVAAASPFIANNLKGRRQQYNFIADVVEGTAPAVVYIEIKDTRRRDFFTGKPQTISNGSGFIINSDGLVLTNAHVVTNKPSARVEVKLINGQIYEGTVEDVDMKSDLATVRIQARNLPVMRLGSSSDIKPGEFVVAMGSPLALSNTVTSGVVSSTQRGSQELGLTGKDMVYIQTDAAITFGNSGGPLVNLDGEAIGVNSMKVTQGISFAIPIDYVKVFLNTVKNRPPSSDRPKRLFMGITMMTLTPDIIHEMKMRNQYVPPDLKTGILVWKVIIGSPAYNGGLQPGDIVTHIDGKEVTGAADIYSILAEHKTRTLTLTVTRYGKKIDLSVTPEDVY